MKVNSLKIENFRNLKDVFFQPGEGVNVIYGDNAQGKTNLTEAIWLFTGSKSFRGAKDSEMILFGSQKADLQLDFSAAQRGQEARLQIAAQKKASLNQIPLTSVSRLAGVFCAVVFSPVHLSLIKDGPQQRRRFIDYAICQIQPRYASVLTEYKRSVVQRNALLKDMRAHPELSGLLDVWEEKIAVSGAKIMVQRNGYIQRLLPLCREIYSGISSSKETFTVEYETASAAAEKNNAAFCEAIKKSLADSRQKDIILGVTSVGPHRDDVGVSVNGISARTYGSQGQQRSCVLSLKLGEAALLEEMTGERPIILLDDVMSELDAGRQDYILNHIDGRQVFITCCDPSSILKLCAGKAFEMRGGELLENKGG